MTGAGNPPEPVPPREVVELARSRSRRREAKDYDDADRLRTAIESAGWRVLDGPDGFTLRPIAHPDVAPRRLRPDEVPSLLDRRPTADVSVHWLVEGWPADVIRGIDSFRRHEAGRRVQHVVVDLVGADPSAFPDGIEWIALVEDPGWARARNAGLRRSRGSLVLVVDGSIEAAGDVFSPLADALRDPTVGICGPFGIVTDDLQTFSEPERGHEPGRGPGPDVDAIESYLLAVPRSMLLDAGLFDEGFRFYRTCDVEYSFRVKDTGRRAVVVDVPVVRHEHRMWSTTPPERRDRLSRRNFSRFLDRFRERSDLTVSGARREANGHGTDAPA